MPDNNIATTSSKTAYCPCCLSEFACKPVTDIRLPLNDALAPTHNHRVIFKPTGLDSFGRDHDNFRVYPEDNSLLTKSDL
ncbi:hypothetical protein, partial [Roseibium sp. RKSG952]|uniref:hypothetical protein n=1 Tax=Roseibium sp. RKSG952 TaxID=2529384 RepID=UPI001AD8C7D4